MLRLHTGYALIVLYISARHLRVRQVHTMRQAVIIAAVSLGVSCRSMTAPTASSVTFGSPTLSPPAGSVLHAGDTYTAIATYTSFGLSGWFAFGIVLERDDGAEYLLSCDGGSLSGRGSGGGGHFNVVLNRFGSLYSFGLHHAMNAVMVGATFDVDPFGPLRPCPVGTLDRSANWSRITVRADAPLN